MGRDDSMVFPAEPNSLPLSGLLVLDKPLGLSSAAAVARVRRAARGAKVGHAGTLDPLATGVLLCCLGRATRCAAKLMDLPKTYEAVVDLSAFTASDDRESPPQVVPVAQPPTQRQVHQALAALVGDIAQRPPRFSAVHVGGRRAYQLARQGQWPDLAPRIVHVAALELLAYAWPHATLRVQCGKGTYIRSLARDLGLKLGTGGHLAALRRTAVGPYTLAMAICWDRLDRPLTVGDLLPPPSPPL